MNAPSPRSDARDNRARIVEAARDAIAAAAPQDELRLNAVAQKAGVGQGTLYRHFPTRADLLVEVYRHDVDELVALAPVLLENEEPIAALALWFDRVAAYARVKRGVFAALEASVWRDLSAHSLGPIGEAITLLLDAGRATGAIRPDVDASDVITLIGFLTRLDDSDWDNRSRRSLRIVLDGLRTPLAVD
ncbi:TetR/AcrR family transcriptional regulator [soil metagenome]